MNRPLRIEFPGALYHVTARGNRRGPIYATDSDRYRWLNTLALVCERFHFVVYAYCQMTDHYHLMIETPEGKLARGLRQLNSIYAQYWNRHHATVGHLFQGRYKAILVEKDSHLLELTRYIVLNPVRAGMTKSASQWFWSSYHATAGETPAPRWLDVNWVLGQFNANKSAAISAYKQFIEEGRRNRSPLLDVKEQIFLGNPAHPFKSVPTDIEIPRPHRRAVEKPLAFYSANFDRDEAMVRAYVTTLFTQAEIGRHFGVSNRTVLRALKRFGLAAD
jgi:REP element-mobilizing transposase RayT